MKMDALSKIAMKHGGDKFGSHVYTPIYDNLFREIRNDNLKILEIGIGGYTDPNAGGASLLTWAEYFPNSLIIGMDLQEKKIAVPHNVKIVQCSQVDFDKMQSINAQYGPFDIVIDDASHISPLTQQTFLYQYPKIAAAGLYIIEDTQTSFQAGQHSGTKTIVHTAYALSLAMQSREGFVATENETSFPEGVIRNFPNHGSLLAGFGDITESVSIYRNLLVFKRGDNSYPTNAGLDFSHHLVKDVYEAMEQGSSLALYPTDALARIDMNIWAGRIEEAARLAMVYLEKYPREIHLLHQLKFMMGWAKREDELRQIQHAIRDCEGAVEAPVS